MLLAALAGCGSSGPSLYSVEGKILVDGKPLTGGSVSFHPDAAKQNSSTKVIPGKIGQDGSYQLFTDGRPGAPLGWYKVTVVSTSEADSSRPDLIKSFVGRKFADRKITPLSVEVKAAPATGEYDLKVSAR
jgi:hypothetical protein